MKQFLTIPIFLLLAISLFAGNEPLYVKKLESPIVFDGWVNDDEWGQIEPFELLMQIPNLGDKPSGLSEVRIAYDDEYIYLSGRLYDTESQKIMANTKKRDALTGSTQWFGFIIDTYNDNENALAFFTTPTGIRWDVAVFNDGLGTMPINLSWNAFWDVKVQRNHEGWFAELRVPFSSLSFEEKEEVTMGITTWHYVARKNEMAMYPLIPPDYGDWSSFRPSLAKDMIFRGIKSKKPFYLTPYLLTGYNDVNELNDPENAYINDSKAVFEIGGDIKYGISKNWTADLSINTDFAQVEADDQQVNLTRFNLFFPEKRLFFQERSGMFQFNFGMTDQLFYSRRIGINEDDEPQRIYGGARIVGRSGGWDLGFLSMQTATDGDFQGENLSVFRAKRDVINENSDVGVIITNRSDLNGRYNTTYGLDANIRVREVHYLSVRWAQTITDDNNYSFFSMDPTRAWISLSSRNQRGFGYGTSISRAGESFDPGLGFETRDNYTRFGNRLHYNWFGDNNSKFFSHGVNTGGAIHWGNGSGRLESLNWRIGYEFNFKNQLKIKFDIKPNIENLLEEFELSDDVVIPLSDYNFTSLAIEAVTPPSVPLWAMISFEKGGFYDGDRTSFSINPTFNISSSLELGGTYEYNLARFDERNEEFLVHLGRLKALVMFSTKLSISALLQYNSLNKNFTGNVRLRYNPAEGNDLYLVWNDDVNTDLFRENPYLPRSNQRTILLKYSYTFRK